MKKILIVIPLILGVLVFADYHGWLGVKKSSELDYFSLTFMAEDEDTGQRITDFFINCTRRGSREACSIESGLNQQTRKIKFGVIKNTERSWLFDRGEQIIGIDDVDVYLMFIHPDYERRTYTYSMKELLAMQGRITTVKLRKSTHE